MIRDGHWTEDLRYITRDQGIISEEEIVSGYEASHLKAMEVYQEGVGQALEARKEAIERAWKVHKESAQQAWTIFQGNNRHEDQTEYIIHS